MSMNSPAPHLNSAHRSAIGPARIEYAVKPTKVPTCASLGVTGLLADISRGLSNRAVSMWNPQPMLPATWLSMKVWSAAADQIPDGPSDPPSKSSRSHGYVFRARLWRYRLPVSTPSSPARMAEHRVSKATLSTMNDLLVACMTKHRAPEFVQLLRAMKLPGASPLPWKCTP